MIASFRFVLVGLICWLNTGILAHAQSPADTSRSLQLLRQSGPYHRKKPHDFPTFTYQSASAPELQQLRQQFNLDSVAGNGTDVERATRLLAWLHANVLHQDVRNHAVINATNIIMLSRTKGLGQGCYPLAVSLTELYLAVGFKARAIICFSKDLAQQRGGHVVTAVFLPSQRKWVYMDPTYNAYLTDKHGHLLSVQEVRQHLIAGQTILVNKTANYRPNEAFDSQDYLYNFIALHLYRLLSPLHNSYNFETLSPGADKSYVELLPLGSGEPANDKFETGTKKGYNVTSYHTNNDQVFWAKP